MVQGLEQCEAVGGAIRQIKLRLNSQSITRYDDGLRILASVPDAETTRDIASRPVFAAVERVIVDLMCYPLMEETDSATLRAARDKIRCLPSTLWDARMHGALHFLYPSWYLAGSDDGHSIASISESEPNDWDLLEDVLLYSICP